MAHGNIEHVNISVTDPERSLRLFEDLLGWTERWRGPSMLGGRTIHVGNNTDYLAIYTNDDTKGGFTKSAPLNHIGVLVDDIDAAEKVVLDHGLETMNHGDYEPGRRFYFLDWDGIEFEVISYAGDAR